MTASASSLIPVVLLYNVLEPLVKIGADGSINPLLAERWDISEDGMTYTFHLREAMFHDGEPLTADDVKFTLDRAADPVTGHPFGWHFEIVDSVTATDDRTVVVELNRPSNIFLYRLGLRSGAIYPERSVNALANHPIGTGPFRFVEWQQGTGIDLERNDSYWGEPAFLEQVSFRYYAERDGSVNALLAGDVDLLPNLLVPPRINEFQNPSFVIKELPSTELVWVGINHDTELLQDVRIRQAMSLAIDREASIAALGGYRVLGGPHVPPTDPWVLLDTPINDYDPDRARSLLAEAGYPDGIDVTIRVPGTPKLPPVAELIASQWAEVGIRVTLQVDELAVWYAEVQDPARAEFEVTVISDEEPRGIHLFQDEDNYNNYYNQELDDLLTAADAALTSEEQIRQYQAAQELLAEELPFIWLWVNTEIPIMKSGLTGYTSARIDVSTDLVSVRWEG